MTDQAINMSAPAREYLQLLCTELEILAALSSLEAAACYHKAITTLTELKAEEDEFLAAIVDTVKGNPFFLTFPTLLQESKKALQIITAIPPADSDQAAPRACDPNQDTSCNPPNCNTYPSQVDVAAANIAVASLDLATAIAEAAMVVIPQEALGIPNPAYIAAAAAYGGLNIDAKIAAEVAAVLQRQADINADCLQNGYNTMLQGICCTTTIIKHNTEELIQKVDILINLAEDIKKTVDTMSLRQIEQILASCSTLASLYLPKAFGGHLEEVAQLVQTLINQSKAAGLNTCNAQSLFYVGQIAMSKAEYKKAYKWFSEAYQQLICC